MQANHMARDKDVGFFLEWIVSEFGLCGGSDSSVFFLYGFNFSYRRLWVAWY
jgi:hypothetical protein